MSAGRYSRQELFAPIGPEGQARLRRARVAIVGCGALGSTLAEMMTRAGVGSLSVIDRDYVEESNLQRQSLFDEDDAARGLPKAAAAEARLRAINSDVAVRGVVADLAADNAAELVRGADIVLDGTDNFETRFLLNDVCLKAGIPWVYGACVGSYGLALLVRPHVSPCLRCVLEEMPGPGGPTCDTVGVVAPVVHVVAGLQAGEALKMLGGRPQDLLPGVVTVDLWKGRFEVMDLGGRAPWCPACTEGRYDYLEAGTGTGSAVLCGRDAVQVRPPRGTRVDLPALAGRLSASGDVAANEHLVRFRAPGTEIVVFGDGRAIVRGVKDAAQARSLYARYVGS
jgi:molybdopterin/thiamine biosynthesis adenylyltransferase